jgi:membrane protein required for colicin V production
VNWLDYLIVAVLAFSTVRSFLKGFTREIAGLVAALLALVLAMWFYGLAGSYVSPYVGAGAAANAIGFAIVAIGVLIAGSLTGWIVSRFVGAIGLSFFDRLLGAAFGFLRGLLITMAILTAYTAFSPHGEKDSAPSAVVHSRIAPRVLEASHLFVAIAPMELKRSFGKGYVDIEAAISGKAEPGAKPPAQKEFGDK